jgi:hypothetical protein
MESCSKAPPSSRSNNATRELSAAPHPPLLDPDEVAEGIVLCAQRPKREVTYRRVGRVVELLHSMLPRLYELRRAVLATARGMLRGVFHRPQS